MFDPWLPRNPMQGEMNDLCLPQFPGVGDFFTPLLLQR
jgi:hypothetical protein